MGISNPASFESEENMDGAKVVLRIKATLLFDKPPRDADESIMQAKMQGLLQEIIKKRSYLYSNDLATELARAINRGGQP